MELTQEALKKVLHYAPDTGVFTRVKPNGCTQVGHKRANVGLFIKVHGVQYPAGRLAVLYMTGESPGKDRVRYIDGDVFNTKYANLEVITATHSCRTNGVQKNNKSGVRGVHRCNRTDAWRVSICHERKRMHIGYFKEISDAAKARWDAEVQYNYPDCYSTSSAFNYIRNSRELYVQNKI